MSGICALLGKALGTVYDQVSRSTRVQRKPTCLAAKAVRLTMASFQSDVVALSLLMRVEYL